MFHTTNPALLGRPHGVVLQTGTLQATASELRAASSCLSKNLPDAFFSVFRLLGVFSGQLPSHFQAGETALHLDAIARECPSLERRARVLERAHDDLRASFASTRALVAGREKVCTLELSTRIDGLLDAFEQHEEAERELLQDFFQQAGQLSAVNAEA